jgi:hypothetical protein
MQQQERGPGLPSQAEQSIKGGSHLCVRRGIPKTEDPAEGVNDDQHGPMFLDPTAEEVLFHGARRDEERVTWLQPKKAKVTGYISRSILERHKQHGALLDTSAEERPPLCHRYRKGPGEGGLPGLWAPNEEGDPARGDEPLNQPVRLRGIGRLQNFRGCEQSGGVPQWFHGPGGGYERPHVHALYQGVGGVPSGTHSRRRLHHPHVPVAQAVKRFRHAQHVAAARLVRVRPQDHGAVEQVPQDVLRGRGSGTANRANGEQAALK